MTLFTVFGREEGERETAGRTEYICRVHKGKAGQIKKGSGKKGQRFHTSPERGRINSS